MSMPAPDRGAIDRRDDRLVDVRDGESNGVRGLAEPLLALQYGRFIRCQLVRAAPEVAARAKRIAGAGHHDYPHVRIVLRVEQALPPLRQHAVREGIFLLGTIQQ
jgi:hypothetical protein